ncbi:MAG: SCP2 sterol-binding domain-containing protein [Pseudonocardiaceae bacterium]
MTHATKTDWQQGQDALRNETERVTTLLRSIQDPTVPAVGSWNLGDLAMHLSQVWMAQRDQAKGDLSRIHELLPDTAGTAGGSLVKSMWDLSDLWGGALKNDPERDLGVLADRIDAEAAQYFSECAVTNPDTARPWTIEGFTFPPAMFTYNLLNETLIHGYDIAHAAGRRYPIEPSHATIALEWFALRVLQQAPPQTFASAKAANLRATYDVRIRGGGSYYFIFNAGDFAVEEPSSRKVDCHISADPVALLLVFWARQSQWPAIAKGKLMAWGRKPWLGLQLRSFLRNP